MEVNGTVISGYLSRNILWYINIFIKYLVDAFACELSPPITPTIIDTYYN